MSRCIKGAGILSCFHQLSCLIYQKYGNVSASNSASLIVVLPHKWSNIIIWGHQMQKIDDMYQVERRVTRGTTRKLQERKGREGEGERESESVFFSRPKMQGRFSFLFSFSPSVCRPRSLVILLLLLLRTIRSLARLCRTHGSVLRGRTRCTLSVYSCESDRTDRGFLWPLELIVNNHVVLSNYLQVL